MALWDKISSRGNVEDRRAIGSVAIGGISATGIALYFLVTILTGGEIDVNDVLSQLENVQVPNQSNLTQKEFEGEDDYEVFASTVLGSKQ